MTHVIVVWMSFDECNDGGVLCDVTEDSGLIPQFGKRASLLLLLLSLLMLCLVWTCRRRC